MRRLALAVLVLSLVPAACKKDSSSGLPPATDWNQSGPVPANPHANPHGSPHANPHGPGVAGANPHPNVDTSGGGAHGAIVPQQTPPRTLEKLPGGRLALGPFSLAPPAGWTEKPITSSMRAAQFAIAGDAGEAELVITHFGEDGAGGVDDNVGRWLDMFQQAGGKSSKDVAKIEKLKVAGQEATLVFVSGRYVTTTMPGGGDPIDRPDQALIAAIVGSPRGPYYWKLVGPKQTVDAQAAKVRAMFASMTLR
jgi:hypothetical protein